MVIGEEEKLEGKPKLYQQRLLNKQKISLMCDNQEVFRYYKKLKDAASTLRETQLELIGVRDPGVVLEKEQMLADEINNLQQKFGYKEPYMGPQ